MRPSSFRRAVPGLLLCCLALLISACNFPGIQSTTEDTQATAAAQTVAAQLTQAALEPPATATATPPAPSETPAATATEPGSSATPEPTACTDRASFITDVTIPDDTYMEPGETFTKTWRLRNNGTCTWNSEYDLVFVSGEAMGAPAAVPLPGNVPPNSTVDLSVELTVPSTEDTHRGNFMLRNAAGINFGIGANADVAFWVQIIVGSTPTPEPSVYMTEKDDLNPNDHVDLDEGDFSPSGGDSDLWYETFGPDDNWLTPENGAEIAVWTSGVPGYGDCEDADLDDDTVSFDDFSEGDWICFKTSEDRIGRLEIDELTGPDPPDVTIDIRTWE
jgi:hypothetical protein